MRLHRQGGSPEDVSNGEFGEFARHCFRASVAVVLGDNDLADHVPVDLILHRLQRAAQKMRSAGCRYADRHLLVHKEELVCGP